jgi:hypothetical protein
MNSNVSMKQQTETRAIRAVVTPTFLSANLPNNHLSLTGLSMKQRHPKGYHRLPVPVRNSTHLHPTHSHLR